MHLILLLKLVHVLAAILFLGTGLGSACYKLRADRSGDVRVVAWCQRNIVLADWLFTVPSGIALPLTGIWLAHIYRFPLTTPWILTGIVGYCVAGIAWLPAAWLQILMRRLADAAVERDEPLPPLFMRYHRIWLGLGFPSFTAAIVALAAMVTK